MNSLLIGIHAPPNKTRHRAHGLLLMRTVSLILVSLAAMNTPSFAQVRVAVTPFEADHSLQRYAPYARGELENLVMNFGNVAIVERARMDQMTKELSFGSFSGMTDPGQVAKFGKMAGATILLTGSLLKVDVDKKAFGGFGIGTSSSQSTATIRIRAYDIEKGTVIHSSTVNGSSSSFKTNFGGAGKADESSAAIEDALKTLGKDTTFKELFAKLGSSPTQAGQVKIELVPTPGNCDIEVNGVYKGSTPATLEFTQGSTVTIKLSKAGYLPWEKTVASTSGMRISPELEKKP
jgi:hypothetical protein